jgi:hypothetical protein
MTSKTIDDTVTELVNTHFPSGIGVDLTTNQERALRQCIMAALVAGGIMVTSGDESSPLVRAMAQSAREFESTLGDLDNTVRIPSAVYPWGWYYQDPDIQDKFRKFCRQEKQTIMRRLGM